MNTKRKYIRETACVLAVCLSGTASTAHANYCANPGVAMVFTGNNVIDDQGRVVAQPGEQLNFDLVMDFGDNCVTFGGGFDVNWDESAFDFVDYTSANLGDMAFERLPVLEPGRLFNGAVGAFATLNQGVIASLSFTFIGTVPGEYAVTPSGTDGDAGMWLDGNDFSGATIDNVTYFSGVVIYTPLPSAVWFLLSGLGILAGFRKPSS